MSSERFELVQFKKGRNDKVFAVRLGSATKRDDGGFWVNFDALPFGEGSCAIVPPREKGADTTIKREVNAMRRELAEDDGVPF